MSAVRRPPLPTTVRATGTALVVALLAAGCASGAGTATDTTSSVSASATETPAVPTPSATPSGTAGADEDPGDDAGADVAYGSTADADPSADALLTVTDLRTGSHDDYDRVVIDLAGTGTPGWHAEVGTEAVEDPTGDSVDVGGSAVLTLYLTGIGLPSDTGETELAAGTVVAGGDAITAAEFSGTFEGQAQVFVGLADATAQFRVLLLQDPLRVVIDVQR